MHNKQQQGFTLIELLVVVSVLAAMATVAVVAIGGYDQRAREELVVTEMKQIANAIYRFKRDTGYYPEQGPFAGMAANQADLGFLFVSPRDDGPNDSTFGAEQMPWNLDAGRGWNGPYLSADNLQRMSLEDCDLPAGVGGLDIFALNVTRTADRDAIIALDDPFERSRTYTNTDSCFVLSDKGTWMQRNAPGQAYRYDIAFTNNLFPQCPTSGNGCVALLSAGPDGEYDNGGDDDIVRILGVN
ncbi:type II secretion system protein [Motiliproteus sp.]|uniref:type II secretion system protein n=1 Tax=Motiliproteus sp. TaxID=1898955 RepID=UPI003BAAA0FA